MNVRVTWQGVVGVLGLVSSLSVISTALMVRDRIVAVPKIDKRVTDIEHWQHQREMRDTTMIRFDARMSRIEEIVTRIDARIP